MYEFALHEFAQAFEIYSLRLSDDRIFIYENCYLFMYIFYLSYI